MSKHKCQNRHTQKLRLLFPSSNTFHSITFNLAQAYGPNHNASRSIYVSAANWGSILAGLPNSFPQCFPTITSDTWQCATVNASQYFDPPKATGDLLTAIISYADKIAEDCTRTRLEANPTGVFSCPFPEVSQWCAFSKVVEPSITAAYSAYGSAASSWWAAKSSGASSVAARCPKTWYKVMVETPAGAPWLNETIIFSECYVSAHAPTAHASALGTGKPGNAASSELPTSTPSVNNVKRGSTGNGMLAAAGASLAVAAAVL